MFRKVLLVLAVAILSFSTISTTALASEGFKTQKSKDDFEIKKPIDESNELDELELIDPEYTTQAIVVQMGLPIKHQARVPNAYLKEIIDNYQDKSRVLTFLQGILFYRGVTAPAGLMNVITSAVVGGSLDEMMYAWARGDDMYVVTVYASGKAPSLSTISYRYFSSTRITFVE